jgi:hypothetical protein
MVIPGTRVGTYRYLCFSLSQELLLGNTYPGTGTFVVHQVQMQVIQGLVVAIGIAVLRDST